MTRKLTIRDIHLENRRILIRCDFNVPLQRVDVDPKIKPSGYKMTVTDARKIETHIPTIQLALERGARAVILISSIGKPQGRRVDDLSLEPVAEELSRLLAKDVIYVHDCVGAEASKACAHPEPGSVILLENLRFHPEEEGYGIDNEGKIFNPSERSRHAFINALSHLADIFVNDAFKGDRHEHSASYYINLPKRVAGLQVEKEMAMLDSFCTHAPEPVLLILGGNKLKKKAEFLFKVVELVDEVIVGGELAFPFIKAKQPFPSGDVQVDDESIEIAKTFMAEAAKHNVQVRAPTDVLCVHRDNQRKQAIFDTKGNGIPSGFIPMDIGPKTIARFREAVNHSRTVLWNGPLGVVEYNEYQRGTGEVLDEVIAMTQAHKAEGAESIIMGHHIAGYVAARHDTERVGYISLNSRSCLQYLAGKQLHSYHTWLMSEDDVRPRVVIHREKDAIPAGSNAHEDEELTLKPVLHSDYYASHANAGANENIGLHHHHDGEAGADVHIKEPELHVAAEGPDAKEHAGAGFELKAPELHANLNGPHEHAGAEAHVKAPALKVEGALPSLNVHLGNN